MKHQSAALPTRATEDQPQSGVSLNPREMPAPASFHISGNGARPGCVFKHRPGAVAGLAARRRRIGINVRGIPHDVTRLPNLSEHPPAPANRLMVEGLHCLAGELFWFPITRFKGRRTPV